VRGAETMHLFFPMNDFIRCMMALSFVKTEYVRGAETMHLFFPMNDFIRCMMALKRTKIDFCSC
jgi:hypothetical protein